MANENIPYDNRSDMNSQRYEANQPQRAYDFRQQQMRNQQMRNQMIRQSFRNARQYHLRL